MKHRSKRRRAHAMAELAQMGCCERLVVFEHRHGQRRRPHQEPARRQGLAAHERFEQEGLAGNSAGLRHAGRCFVASLLFGGAWQTQALRQFRDKVLRPRGWGRGLIRLYYRGAPRVCAVLERWPVLRRPGPYIAAQLDRAYRLPSGQLVLVELKTRWSGAPNFSDLIQLSAQRVALSAATGQTVAAEAFVLIERPGVRRSPVAHRVHLLSVDQVVALVRRREAILADRVLPRYAAAAGHCRSCAFSSPCDGADRERRS